MCFINVSLSFYESDVVMIEVAGQLAVASASSRSSLALFSKVATASAPAGNRDGGSSRAAVDQRVGERGGIAPLSAVHAHPESSIADYAERTLTDYPERTVPGSVTLRATTMRSSCTPSTELAFSELRPVATTA